MTHTATPAPRLDLPLIDGIAALEPDAVREGLDRDGFIVTAPLIHADICAELARLYEAADERFRSTVTMARHGFGRGEYKYFARPLPGLVASLRRALYERLAPVANGWDARLGRAASWPAHHDELVKRLPLTQGAFAVIPVKERPVQGVHGSARVQVRHGVSRVRRGLRRTLGLIFHDAA
jgi:hypothetical protein